MMMIFVSISVRKLKTFSFELQSKRDSYHWQVFKLELQSCDLNLVGKGERIRLRPNWGPPKHCPDAWIKGTEMYRW
jgi:hypothetical protein